MGRQLQHLVLLQHQDWCSHSLIISVLIHLSEVSTWEQPKEMSHIMFKDPKENGLYIYERNRLIVPFLEIKQNLVTKSPSVKQRFAGNPLNVDPADYPKYQFIQPLGGKSETAKQRVFLESEQNEFFGLNTTVFKSEGVLNGVYNKLEDYYKNTAVVS